MNVVLLHVRLHVSVGHYYTCKRLYVYIYVYRLFEKWLFGLGTR